MCQKSRTSPCGVRPASLVAEEPVCGGLAEAATLCLARPKPSRGSVALPQSKRQVSTIRHLLKTLLTWTGCLSWTWGFHRPFTERP